MTWPAHPAAELLPVMGDEQLDELAADIKANGLRQPIILWQENGTEYLLDGRNRMAALKRIGITDPTKAKTAKGGYREKVPTLTGAVDPVTFVLSLNVHRRHLTSEQKRQAISAYIKADPKASDRKVAKKLGVDHKTVGKVRGGENPQKPAAAARSKRARKVAEAAMDTAPATKPTRKPRGKQLVDRTKAATEELAVMEPDAETLEVINEAIADLTRALAAKKPTKTRSRT